MIDLLQKLQDKWKIIASFVVGLWAIFGLYQSYLNNNKEIMQTLKTTEQMALKSIIWNDAIPDVERENACDIYLKNGWNSYTKKECETILEKDVQEGIFSYVERRNLDEKSVE